MAFQEDTGEIIDVYAKKYANNFSSTLRPVVKSLFKTKKKKVSYLLLLLNRKKTRKNTPVS